MGTSRSLLLVSFLRVASGGRGEEHVEGDEILGIGVRESKAGNGWVSYLWVAFLSLHLCGRD